MRLQRITCIMLVVLLGACSGTARVPEKGRCVRADQLFPSHAALVARVDRALAGTDADRAAANVRLVSSSELRLTFPREFAEHADACHGQQAAPEPGGAVCKGGVAPNGTVWIWCTSIKTSCIYQIKPEGPSTTCAPNPPGPPA
jgi:hypothetical protein